MSHQDSWWFRTEHFWLNYENHWAMTGMVKTYYLTQFAYWSVPSFLSIDEWGLTVWEVGCNKRW
jgi:hypothetical protein